jgi:hypothetical protein
MIKAEKQTFHLVRKLSYKKLRELASENDLPEYANACDELLDRYRSPNGFLEWNEYVKFCLVSGCANSLVASMRAGDAKGAISATNYRFAVMSCAPARYLSKQIIESFVQTATPELPKEITGVFSDVHLMLPRKTVFDAEGDEVIAIMIKSGKLYAEEITEEKAQIMKTFFPKDRVAPPELLGAEGLQIATMTDGGIDVLEEFLSPDAKSWHESNVKYVDNSKYRDDWTIRITRIAINSLLVHLYEPELITADKSTTTKGTGFSSGKKQPLPVTWIGKTFRRQSQKRETNQDPKSHVRSHWRRGHWHTVLFGKGRQERRVQWFRPVFVNPPS